MKHLFEMEAYFIRHALNAKCTKYKNKFLNAAKVIREEINKEAGVICI